MKNDVKNLKEKIETAKKAVEGMEEPLKTKTYEIILNKLLETSDESETKIVEDKKIDLDIKKIPTVEGKSLPEQLISLLSSEWGKYPRTLNEIKEMLANNGLHYPVTTLSARLCGLTRKGRLRRLKQGKTYSYVLGRK
jgi:hypothetical protein